MLSDNEMTNLCFERKVKKENSKENHYKKWEGSILLKDFCKFCILMTAILPNEKYLQGEEK